MPINHLSEAAGPRWTARKLAFTVLVACGCGEQAKEPYTRFRTTSPSTVGAVEGAVVVVGDDLYVFSGFLPWLKATASIEAFDFRAQRWREVGEMPAPVTHVIPTVVDEEVVWFAGGFKGDHPGEATDEVWRYDTDSRTWLPGPRLPAPRGGGGLVHLNRRLHYFGGFAEDRHTNLAEHWVLPLDGDTVWRPAAPLPEPRGQLGAVALDGYIYAIGGQFGHDTLPVEDVDHVHRYDPATNSWTEVAPLPYPRSHFEQGTFVLNGRIVIVGGRSNVHHRDALQDVTMYDPEADVWVALPPLPEELLGPAAGAHGGRLVVANGSVLDFAEPQTTTWLIDLDGRWEKWPALPVALGEVAGGIIGDRLYLVGEAGTPDGQPDSARTAVTLAYHLSHGLWEDPAARARRPFPDNHHAAEVWEGKLYVFGGMEPAAGKTQIYDPAANSWTLGPDVPFAAGSSASALIGGKIFVAGGIIGHEKTTGRMAMFDPRTGTWTERAPMPLPRNHAASATDGRRLFVFGGRGPGSGDANMVANGFADVQIYDPATDRWTTSAEPGSDIPRLPQARGGMGKAVYLDGEFYVLGGETKDGDGATEQGVYARVDIYDPVSKTWRSGPAMPAARHGIFPLAVGGRIYVAGGGTRAAWSQSDVLDVLNPLTRSRERELAQVSRPHSSLP